MIIIEHNEQNYEYDLYSIVKAFFPREEIKLVNLTEQAKSTGGEKSSEFSTGQTQSNEFPVGEIKSHATSEDSHVRKRNDEDFAKQEPQLHIFMHLSKNEIELRMYDATGELLDAKIFATFTDAKLTKRACARNLYQMLLSRTGKTLPWGTLTGIRPSKIVYGMLEDGKSREEIDDYMKQAYLVSDEKEKLAYTVAVNEKKILAPVDYENGYSLYIGIPFCPSTCLYCSFTSYPIGVWKKRIDEYLDAVFREIDYVAEAFSDKKLDSIYIGGGTPTSISAEQLDLLLTKIEATLPVQQALEFTVEAGRADSITREKLAVIKSHGVERISINPQTMNQKTLDLIGRFHTVNQVRDSFALAREIGFDCINMDLIVGLPGETIDDVAYTLSEIKKLNPDNLTVHSLALKRSARLNLEWKKYQDYLMENSEEHIALAMRTAEELAMEPYYMYRQKNMAGNMENIGFSKAGKAGIYNILIMEEKQSIVALGAGASTKRVYADGRIERCENVKDVGLYIDRIDEMIERKRELFRD